MKRIVVKIFLILTLIITPIVCIGETYNGFGLNSENLKNKFGTQDLPSIAGNAIKIFIGLSATIMLIMILWSGFQLMFSSGKEKERKAAIDRIIWTSVGVIIIVSAYAISQFIINQINSLSK